MRSNRALLAIVLLTSAVIVSAQQKPLPYPPVVTAAPYTGLRITTTYEKLADGTQISHQKETWMARNSQGWQLYKVVSQNVDALRRDGKDYTWYTLWNPILRTRTDWCDCRKVGHVVQYGDPIVEQPHRTIPPEGMDVYLANGGGPHLKYHVTSIPGQVLQGEPTEGSDAVRLVKAGVDGNDKDLHWSIKSWYSTRLHLALATITDDPFKGLSKFEFVDLKTTEPDPKLFLVPEGYPIVPQP